MLLKGYLTTGLLQGRLKNTGKVQALALGTVINLVPATGAIGDYQCVNVCGTHGR
jgi:hypothetical protein